MTNLIMQGYRDRNAFIATQAPLAHTRSDLWSLVWDYKCDMIIMLCTEEQQEVRSRYSHWR